MAQLLQHREHVELVANQSNAMPGAPQLIAGSWRRCLSKHHLNPDSPPSAQILESHHLKEHTQRHDYLLGVAQQELVDLYNQMQGSGYSIFLTDAEGIVLQQVCDPNYVQFMRSAGLRIGANWSEQANGTNGVGTCIVEQRPLTVHLEDHFHTTHTQLSCSAAPIRDPSGNLLAVLDSSTARTANPRGDHQTLGLVRNTASFIEGLYFLRLHRSDIIVHLGNSPDIVPQPRNPMIAVTANGCISGANERALMVLGVPNRQALFGRDIKYVLDLRSSPVHAGTAGQIRQLRLIDRGTMVYATWQSPAPENLATDFNTTAKPAKAPLSEKTRPVIHGDPALEESLETSVELLNQNIALLLQGETGSGKDTIARALHNASRYKDGDFIAIDCSSASVDTLSQLCLDKLAEAGNSAQCPVAGTLFLNDANLMSTELQAVLVERLHQHERTAEHQSVGFNLICACRGDLHTYVQEQKFREDLYYRLAQFQFDIAPLRDRSHLKELIQDLLERENIRQSKRLSLNQSALAQLLTYNWPGNIRELQSVLRTAVTICRHEEISEAILPTSFRKQQSNPHTPANETSPDSSCNWTGLEAAEYEVLLQELRLSRWNISATAKKVNMSRNTIYRKMEKYGLSAEMDSQS